MKRELAFLTILATVMTLLALPSQQVSARIKLATLPVRERVEIQLDHGSYSLVEEERIVPLLKSTPERGNNFVDFSWANTRIHKDSVLFRPLAVRDGDKFVAIGKTKGGDGKEIEEVGVINVAFPPSENALVWEIYSARACAVKVRVSYLISELGRSFSYRALTDKAESKLTLSKYMTISNFSGEDFGESGIWAGFGSALTKFMPDRTETKVLVHKFDDVPVTRSYTFDWYKFGALSADKPFASKVLTHYRLENTEKNKMGRFPLQPGKVRIFIEDGRGGEAFLGEDIARLTPIDDEMKLYIGEARDIVCNRTIETSDRSQRRGNLHDLNIVIKYEIENFKTTPATLTIVEQLNRLAGEQFATPPGFVEWERGPRTSAEMRLSRDQGVNTPELQVDLPAAPADGKVEKVVVRFNVVIKNIWN